MTGRRIVQIVVVFALGGANPPHAAAQDIADCVKKSLISGATAALYSVGIPEIDQSGATALLGIKTAQACAINAVVGKRNARYKTLLGAEVKQFRALDSLFHKVELVVAYGDAPGTQVVFGGSDLSFLKLLPTMLGSDWLRGGQHGKGSGSQRARPAVSLVTGSAAMVRWFGPQAGPEMRRYQAGVEGAETAIAAALTAEDEATDAVAALDSLEQELRAGAISSGRARQLRAAAAVRTALMTNQRLREAAAGTRTTTDLAMTGGIGSPITRMVSSPRGGKVRP